MSEKFSGLTREDLIDYAYYCNGNYRLMNKAVKEKRKVDKAPSYENAITVLDNEYPKSLLNLKNPPFVLFYKGNPKLLKKDRVSIIGSRQPTDYAKNITAQLAKSLSNKVIVSGMALGIDTYAHENATHTIAVLGTGIDYIYPTQNKELYQRIVNEGLVISEYPGKTGPVRESFLERNRIVAALGKTIYVMQCSKNSGTINTVNTARELEKEIKVLPFQITERGIYNNYLIDEGLKPLTGKELDWPDEEN